ncbi:PREDICTED: RNA polymerase II-associated factor 1 homolog [Lepidothrix coronata]|uniref:RNA polymerase II-associated factor 1 homolog n=1 Tax=Lepidothrix coronata TaxID=321398 RepID=A0A6J0J825_9PASS|nr:PREDICTED: RNA polymerase II-associated factor 1 homolog [Lepidothrix coronata]
MAPTIQTQAQRDEPGHRPSSHRTLPERSGVVCRVKFCNGLPDIPFDPKFITYPFDQSRFGGPQKWGGPEGAQVIFDSDPAPKDTSGAAALEMMSQAMIRGMMDEEGNQFVAYFLPVEETLRKRKRDQEEDVDYAPEDVYDYKIAREYNWNVKNKASKGYEENYFFIFREGDGVYYNELETRVRLSKRRARAGVQSGTNAVLVVKHRDMNEKELEAQVGFGGGPLTPPDTPPDPQFPPKPP